MDTTALPHGGIVVGVDASPGSDHAVAWAADEAALDHRPLILAYAAGTDWFTETDDSSGALLRDLHRRGDQAVAAAAERVAARQPSVEVHTTVVAEEARTVLLALAQTASMVVVGSRGRGPVRSLLLGSVSAAVARHATCPVVVVRPHQPGIVRRGVLVGADGSAEGQATLEFAYRAASIRHLPLTVMHCVWDVVASVTAPAVVAPGEAGLEEGRLLLAESVAGMAEKYPDVHVTLELGRGLPEQCLGPAAERMDLLVVGRRHSGVMARLLFGDVPGDVVEHGRTVVAVVPEVSAS